MKTVITVNAFKSLQTTSALCKAANVTRGQLRLYEEEGLIAPKPNGSRLPPIWQRHAGSAQGHPPSGRNSVSRSLKSCAAAVRSRSR
ncbi:MAG: MerR family transcriptional regulator [Simplicispira sp.]|nr:MerR family transcriptional regulator [Simplicispira sp.]